MGEVKESKENGANTKKFPSDLEELKKDLKQKQPDCQLVLPITRQEEIPEAIKIIQENYIIENIPEWVFQIEELPEPNWDIFTKKELTFKGWEDVEMELNNNDDQ